MKKSIKIMFVIFGFIFTPLYAQVRGDAILGEWLSPDQKARFLIYKNESKYFGRIIWGTGSDSKDIKNPDAELRNRDVVGLTILTNLTFNGSNIWENGTIYDPKNGKTYSCKISLKTPGKLYVRGYIGIAMFGRTETWTRIK